MAHLVCILAIKFLPFLLCRINSQWLTLPFARPVRTLLSFSERSSKDACMRDSMSFRIFSSSIAPIRRDVGACLVRICNVRDARIVLQRREHNVTHLKPGLTMKPGASGAKAIASDKRATRESNLSIVGDL